MTFFETTYLSEILEESKKQPVIIFKYSDNCGSSDRLSDLFEKNIKEKKLKLPIYKVTVQTMPALSRKISEHFGLKHETPQIIIVNDGKITYTAHHRNIKIDDFVSK